LRYGNHVINKVVFAARHARRQQRFNFGFTHAAAACHVGELCGTVGVMALSGFYVGQKPRAHLLAEETVAVAGGRLRCLPG